MSTAVSSVAMPRRRWWPLLLSTLAAASAPALAYAIAGVILTGNAATVLLGLFAFVVALAHTVLLGLPYALWQMRRGGLRWAPMLAGGWVLGMLPDAVFRLVVAISLDLTAVFPGVGAVWSWLLSGAFGALASGAFLITHRWAAGRATAR